MTKKSFLSLFFAVAFFLAISSIALADDPVRFGSDQFDRFAANHYDDRLAKTAQYDDRLEKTADTPINNLIGSLQNLGVWNIITNLAPEVKQMAETAEGLFHTLSKKQHYQDLAIIVGHFRDNWPLAINRMKKLKGASSEVDLSSFVEFMRAYQDLLDQSIHRDKQLEDSDVVKFMGQLTHLFNALEAAYGNLYFAFKTLKLPIKIDWNIFQMTNMLMQKIPQSFINVDFIQELVQAPNAFFSEMAQLVESLNEKLYESPVGQFMPIILQQVETFVQTWVDQREHDANRLEF